MFPAEHKIPEDELIAYQAEFRGSVFRLIHAKLRFLREEAGFSQEKLAQAISMDPGQLSRVLKGYNDLQLETLSDLARGLGCRIQVNLASIDDFPAESNKTYVIKRGDLPKNIASKAVSGIGQRLLAK